MFKTLVQLNENHSDKSIWLEESSCTAKWRRDATARHDFCPEAQLNIDSFLWWAAIIYVTWPWKCLWKKTCESNP